MRVKLYFATSNENKVREAQQILGNYGIEVAQKNIKKLEIQSKSLSEISLYAARHAYALVKAPVFVEDSGLFIESLNGFPGPYTSYAYNTIGIRGVLKLLEGITRRRAWFEAAVALVYSPYEKVFVGRVPGFIAEEPRGASGFGFDPIFIPEGETRTFGEMGTEKKNSLSHRAKALHELGIWLRKTLERQKWAEPWKETI